MIWSDCLKLKNSMGNGRTVTFTKLLELTGLMWIESTITTCELHTTNVAKDNWVWQTSINLQPTKKSSAKRSSWAFVSSLRKKARSTFPQTQRSRRTLLTRAKRRYTSCADGSNAKVSTSCRVRWEVARLILAAFLNKRKKCKTKLDNFGRGAPSPADVVPSCV